MKIVFLGSGAFGLPSIEALKESHEIVAVVSQPDRKAGRGGKLSPTPISAWTQEHLPKAPLLTPESLNTPEIIRQLHGYEADAWVVIAYGQKLSNELLRLHDPNPIFAINLHGSLLPRHRGAAPIHAAILAGDDQVGNSVITVVEKMDAGDVLGQTVRVRDPMATAGELHDTLAEDGPAALLEVISAHESGTLQRISQDPAAVTLAPKMNKKDGIMDWSQTAPNLQQHVHGFNPWPGATTSLDGEVLKVLRAKPDDQQTEQPPGVLLDPMSGLVSCGESTTLRLIEVQPPGKRPMTFDAFARGRKLSPGSQFG